jgi:hypothetical protein
MPSEYVRVHWLLHQHRNLHGLSDLSDAPTGVQALRVSTMTRLSLDGRPHATRAWPILLALGALGSACGGSVGVGEADSGAPDSVADTLSPAFAGSDSASTATVDAAPDAALDAASEACTPMFPTGSSEGPLGSPISCSSASGETCGTTNYQFSCDCPTGSCVCFGPSTHVVAYDGCPACPGFLPGPPANDIFRLCGFPE